MPLVDASKVECLNEDAEHPFRSILEQKSFSHGEKGYVSSSLDDPQLLLRLGFTRPVRLSSLFIKAPPGSVEAGEAPLNIKLFINDLSMGFSDAESATPVQAVTLEEEKLETGCTVPLRFVKFSNVSSLVVYVESPNGDGPTKIEKLDLFGIPTENMEMKEWKPVKESERLAPNDT